MATDKLKKQRARNAQPPPSAPSDIETAYGNPKVSSSNDVAFEKAPRFTPGGIIADQPREHGAKYPGRSCPTPSPVRQAECKPAGTAKKAADTQVDSNRHEMNRRSSVDPNGSLYVHPQRQRRVCGRPHGRDS